MAGNGAAVDWADIDTCVLDMDGTLLDLHFDDQVWNHHLPRRYAERSGLDQASAHAYVSRTLQARHGTLTWYCMEHWSRVFGLDMNAIERDLADLIRVRPGTVAFLEHLRERGLKVVLATNAHPSSLTHKLQVTGIDAHFDALISSHEFGHAKEEQPFWHALSERIDLNPERTLFVDDNERVLDAAREFGVRYLFGVAQPNSRREAKTFPDYHALACFSELGAAPG